MHTKTLLCTFGLAAALTSSASATLVGINIDITTGTGSSASQSSTLSASYTANNAIDGNTGNFTHTNPPEAGFANAWWEANLSTDRSFNVVRIMNRSDCCQQRLQNLSLFIKDSSGTVISSVTNINPNNSLGSPAFIDVSLGSPLSARFIRVERTPTVGQEDTHDGAALSLGEIRAINVTDTILPSGSDLTHSNLWNMSVSQSTTLGGFSAGSAVNGLTNDFTHTQSSDTNPTYTVDLGEVMNLESFNIGNRGDGCCQYRLRDITVTVKDGSGAVIYTSPLLNPENILGGPSSLADLFPTGLQGRYVLISRTPDPDLSGQGGTGSADDASVLSMSEVRIFGSSIPEPASALLAFLGFGLVVRRRR